MPSRSPVPIGAFKVVYELANRLVANGHQVAIVHPRTKFAPSGAVERVKAAAWCRRYRGRPADLAPWFTLDERVEMIPVAYLDPEAMPTGDAIVAVTWETPACVAAAPAASGRGFYLIQEGVPRPVASEEAVEAAWRLPLRKLVISGWLEEKAVERGEAERTWRVPIGVDLDAWGVDAPLDRRPARIGAMLNPIKGADELVAAFELLHAELPEMGVSCYGTVERPVALPAWADYARLPTRPDLRRLYNSCQVFLNASREEGWGLPGCEALSCGCALVTYDNGGSREFAIDGETAIVVEDHGPEHLAAATLALLRDEPRRRRLAEAGRELVAGFTWQRSVEAFEAAIREAGVPA